MKINSEEGNSMNNFGVQVVSGFCFGTGLIVAAFLMKALLHIGFCG